MKLLDSEGPCKAHKNGSLIGKVHFMHLRAQSVDTGKTVIVGSYGQFIIVHLLLSSYFCRYGYISPQYPCGFVCGGATVIIAVNKPDEPL